MTGECELKALGRMRWLDVSTDAMGMSLSKLRKVVKDREAWRAAVHGITKSRTRLSDAATTQRPLATVSSVVAPAEAGVAPG